MKKKITITLGFGGFRVWGVGFRVSTVLRKVTCMDQLVWYFSKGMKGCMGVIQEATGIYNEICRA